MNYIPGQRLQPIAPISIAINVAPPTHNGWPHGWPLLDLQFGYIHPHQNICLTRQLPSRPNEFNNHFLAVVEDTQQEILVDALMLDLYWVLIY